MRYPAPLLPRKLAIPLTILITLTTLLLTACTHPNSSSGEDGVSLTKPISLDTITSAGISDFGDCEKIIGFGNDVQKLWRGIRRANPRSTEAAFTIFYHREAMHDPGIDESLAQYHTASPGMLEVMLNLLNDPFNKTTHLHVKQLCGENFAAALKLYPTPPQQSQWDWSTP